MTVKRLQKSRIYVGISYLFLFLMMFLWNLKTPFMDEDLDLVCKSFSQIMESSIWDYRFWNSRFLGQTFARILASSGQVVSSLIAAIAFIILIELVARITQVISNHQIQFVRFILLVCSIILFVPDFGSVFIWRAGVGNYLIMLDFELLFLWIFMYKFNSDSSKAKNTFWGILLVFLGIIAGSGNENTSGGLLLICLLLFFFKYRKEEFQWQRISSMVALCIGLLILVLGPGDHRRTMVEHPNFNKASLIKRITSGFIALCHFLHSNPIFMILITIAFIILVYNLFDFRHSPQLISITLIIGAFATILVMSIAPEGMTAGRTYLGSCIFMIMGILMSIPKTINVQQKLFLKITTFTVMAITCLSLLIGIRASRQFNTQLSNRYAYIQKEKSKGHKTIYLTPLVYQPNRYTVAGSYFELTDDPTSFPNAVYKRYYNVDVKLQH